MKESLKKIIEKEKTREKEEVNKSLIIDSPHQDNDRRSFLKKAAFIGRHYSTYHISGQQGIKSF